MELQLNNLHTFSLNHPKQPLFTTSPHHRTTTVKVHAASSNGKQLIQSGTVVAILPKEALKAINEGGYQLLDIRPEWEREKSRVSGSMHVPLFVQDMDNGPITLLKKWVHFGYIGAWTGQYFTMINPDFVDQVEKMVPDKTTKVLVACGEGLRSMMATSKLHKNGYTNLGWLAGGFNRAIDGDFPEVEGPEKLQYATIGGKSYPPWTTSISSLVELGHMSSSITRTPLLSDSMMGSTLQLLLIWLPVRYELWPVYMK